MKCEIRLYLTKVHVILSKVTTVLLQRRLEEAGLLSVVIVLGAIFIQTSDIAIEIESQQLF